jgi:hypothetical protein
MPTTRATWRASWLATPRTCLFGNNVFDQERIVGVGEQPIDAAAVCEVNAAGLVAAVWFFNAS